MNGWMGDWIEEPHENEFGSYGNRLPFTGGYNKAVTVEWSLPSRRLRPSLSYGLARECFVAKDSSCDRPHYSFLSGNFLLLFFMADLPTPSHDKQFVNSNGGVSSK